MPAIALNGTTLHYELDGPEAAPVVALSNSLSTDLRMWNPQHPALAAKYRVLRYDVRGHGRSAPAPAPYSVELLADDLAALLTALNLGPAHIVGLSLGGMTAQVMGIRHPDLCASLALVATTCRPPFGSADAWAKRAQEVRDVGDFSQLEAPMIDRWLTRRFRRANPQGVALVQQMIHATSLEGYAGACHAIGGLDACGQLRDFPRPVRIWAGEEDPGTTVEDARQIAAGIPHATLVIVEHARHLLNWDAEARFTPSLLAWLAEVSA
ncbi:MAG: alpha/beta fold hydrolase [Acetobacteraceae bacterium]|nr:alpha/beta fold hydrolase [Acetobacteraceae bacterium]